MDVEFLSAAEALLTAGQLSHDTLTYPIVFLLGGATKKEGGFEAGLVVRKLQDVKPFRGVASRL